jgi:gluconate 2-dehydrogenase gamma chain
MVDTAANQVDPVRAMPCTLTRRGFLQVGAYASVLACAACGRRSESPRLVLLTAAEYATTAAACERILPRDQDPGAIDLGVPGYIDQALAADQARWADRFRAGLRALDVEARRRAGAVYADATTRAQDDILDDWQDGSPEQSGFIRLLINLTFEGAFGDPSYGGNRGERGWRLIGFAPCEPRHHAG